jgi:hypothetical protein
MPKIKKINIPDGPDIFKHLVNALLPYHTKTVGSYLFIVEGTLAKPRIGIRYPGYKLRKRKLKRPNRNSALWANLLDFEVVPFKNGKEDASTNFTYAKLLKDFEMYKRGSKYFWKTIVKLHDYNIIDKKPPKLGGINSLQFLEMLKWMWMQEDLNYRLSWEDVGSKIRYRLENRNGAPTGKGAGRDKFYAGLILVYEGHFDAASMRKIIP